MPLDNLVDQAPRSQDWGLQNAGNWHLHFCMWPRRCFLTDKSLWLKRCYKGRRRIRRDIEFVFDDFYIEKAEFIFWNLRGRQ